MVKGARWLSLVSLLVAATSCGPPPAPVDPAPAKGCADQQQLGEEHAAELLREGLAAHRAGDGVRARSLLDRARVALLCRGYEERIVALAPVAVADESPSRVGLWVDDRFRPMAGRRRHAPMLGKHVVFERSPWQPRYMLDDAERLTLLSAGAATWRGGPLRVVDDRGVTTLSERGVQPIETAKGVAFLEPSNGSYQVVHVDRAGYKRTAERALTLTKEPQIVRIADDRLRVLGEHEGAAWLRLPALEVESQTEGAALALSPDGRLLASVTGGAPQRVKLHDATTGKLQREASFSPAESHEIADVFVDDEGRMVAVTTWHQSNSSLHLVDLIAGTTHTLVADADQLDRPAFDRTGDHLCVHVGRRTEVFDVGRGHPPRQLTRDDAHCFIGDHAHVVFIPNSPGFSWRRNDDFPSGRRVVFSAREQLAVLLEAKPTTDAHTRLSRRHGIESEFQLRIYDVAAAKVRKVVALGSGWPTSKTALRLDPSETEVTATVYGSHGDVRARTFKLGDGPPTQPKATDKRATSSRLSPLTNRPDVSVATHSIAWGSNHPAHPFLTAWSARKGWRLRLDQPHCRPAFGPGENAIAAARHCAGPSRSEPARAKADVVTIHRLTSGEHRSVDVPFRVEGLSVSAMGRRVIAWGASRVALLEPFGAGAVTWLAPPLFGGGAYIAPGGESVAVFGPAHVEIWPLPGAPRHAISRPMASFSCSPHAVRGYEDDRSFRCGPMVIDLDEPSSPRRSPPPSRRWVVHPSGSVNLVDGNTTLAIVDSDGARGAFALTAAGHLDPLGDMHPQIFCRYGHLLTPLVVCGSRWIREGALASLYANGAPPALNEASP